MSFTNRPKRWISDPAYGMALLASIMHRYPHLNLPAIMEMTGIRMPSLRSINDGRRAVKYTEQVLLESLLPDETVANLHQRYYAIPTPTFWDALLTKGTTS